MALAGVMPTVSSDAIEELEDLTEAVEIQEVIRPGREIALGRREIIGAAQGDGGMPPVRETDDEIRIDSRGEAGRSRPAVREADDGDG